MFGAPMFDGACPLVQAASVNCGSYGNRKRDGTLCTNPVAAGNVWCGKCLPPQPGTGRGTRTTPNPAVTEEIRRILREHEQRERAERPSTQSGPPGTAAATAHPETRRGCLWLTATRAVPCGTVVLAAAIAVFVGLWLLALILLLVAVVVFGACKLLWPAGTRRRSPRTGEP